MTAELLRLVPLLFLLLLLAVTGYVLWRGEWAERSAVAAIALGSVLSAIAARDTGLWRTPETGILLVDVAVLLAFVAILHRSTRFWPLWLTAFQTISVATHLARMLRPETVPLAYAMAAQLWAYPMLAILAMVVLRQPGTTRSTS